MTCIKTSDQKHGFVSTVTKLIPEHKDRIMNLVKTALSAGSETTATQRKNNSSKEMMWAFNNPLFHNVVFVVSDVEKNVRRIPAHKVVLCARSPYFNAMLTGGMKVCLVSLRFVNVARDQYHLKLLIIITQRNHKKMRYISMIPILKHS